jgi:hypothetical protein
VQNLLSSSLLFKNVKVKINRSIISLVVLSWCETWSLNFKEECGQRVFEYRVLRRLFGPTRDEVTGLGKDYVTRTFMLCTPHQLFFG